MTRLKAMLFGFLLAGSAMAQTSVWTGVEEFTPADLSTTVLLRWYDAQNEASGTVSTLTDLSGNGENMSGNGNPQSGARTFNGFNVIDMDGNDYFEDNSCTLPSSGDFTVIMLAAIDSIDSNNDSLWSFNATVNDFQFTADSSPSFLGEFSNTGMGPDNPIYGTNALGPSIYLTVADFTGSGNMYVQIDGINSATISYTSEVDTSGALRLFSNRGETQRPNGWMGEVLVLATGDTDTINKCVGYIAKRWHMQANLPETHTYKHEAPPGTNAFSFLVDDNGAFIIATE